MSALADRISNDLKDAMRAGDVLRRETLRMVIAGLKNRRIELGEELDDDAVRGVLQKALKGRNEAAQQFADAGRDELAAKERAEGEVIQAYLPQPMTEDETREAVGKLAGELGLSKKSEMGQLMKAVMAAHKGRVDGKTVSRIAGELLE